MTITVSGRHVSVSEEMKEYAENRLKAILEAKHSIVTAQIVLDLQKARHKAEVIIHGKHLNIEADSESYDMYESIDAAMGKISRQLQKFFEKKQNHHKNRHGSDAVIDDESIDEKNI